MLVYYCCWRWCCCGWLPVPALVLLFTPPLTLLTLLTPYCGCFCCELFLPSSFLDTIPVVDDVCLCVFVFVFVSSALHP